MILPLLADLALFVAAGFVWGSSRVIAAALALAVVASLVHAWTGIEALRWSSALVGLVGAVELGRRAHGRAQDWHDSGLAHQHLQAGRAHSYAHALELVRHQWHDRWDVGRPDSLALLCLASMVSDGAAYIAWEHLAEWVQPAAQLVMSGIVIAVCVWPRRRTS